MTSMMDEFDRRQAENDLDEGQFFVQVKESDAELFDRLFGPFTTRGEGRRFAEERFSRQNFTVTETEQ